MGSRANAAKAIYEVDNEASIATLDGMLKDQSKRMRASAIWALGEICSEDALGIKLCPFNHIERSLGVPLLQCACRQKSKSRGLMGTQMMKSNSGNACQISFLSRGEDLDLLPCRNKARCQLQKVGADPTASGQAAELTGN